MEHDLEIDVCFVCFAEVFVCILVEEFVADASTFGRFCCPISLDKADALGVVFFLFGILCISVFSLWLYTDFSQIEKLMCDG